MLEPSAELNLHRLPADNSKAQKKWYRALSQRAAVAIILKNHPDLGLSFLMMQRALHDNDPWSGQMSFPGGKTEANDSNTIITALRESDEELNIKAHQVEKITRLSDILARPYKPLKKAMVVTPWVFHALDDFDIQANEEVESAHWLPLSFFQDHGNRESMTLNKFGLDIELPCYFYEGLRVWGLSLMMIDELLELGI